VAAVKASNPATRDEAARLLSELIEKSLRVELPVRAAAAVRLSRLERERGRSAEGFAVLRKLADDLDRPQGKQGAARSPEFWELWSEMLAVMAEENKSGERSGDIRLRIRQLETVDSKLGGGEWAERIREIEKGLK
jgi:hypothetical protein